MTPLVSILIPAYNSGKWIAESIRSAQNQTWSRTEIIVVDDGSRDDTYRIAEQFSSRNVKVVRQENQGAAAARNNAYSHSQGEYIQWLDADDLLDPAKVATQLKAALAGDSRKLYSSEWGSFYFRPERARFTRSLLWSNLAAADWLIYKLRENLFMQTATWLTSREVAEAAGKWDTRLLGDDDGEYFCRVLLASSGVHFVEGSKVFYRDSGSTSLSYVGRSDRKMEAHWLSMQLHVKYIRSLEQSPRVDEACRTYLQTNGSYFFPARMDLFNQVAQLAGTFGQKIEKPKLSWKYAWMEPVFGRDLAQKTQLRYNQAKSSLLRLTDRTLSRLS